MALTGLAVLAVVVALAVVIAAVVEPVVGSLVERGLSRRVAVAVVFGSLAVPAGLVVWWVVPAVVGRVAEFARNPPADVDPGVLDAAVGVVARLGPVPTTLVLIPVLAVYASAAHPGLLAFRRTLLKRASALGWRFWTVVVVGATLVLLAPSQVAVVGGGLLLALAVEPVVGRLARYVPRPVAVLGLLGATVLLAWSASLVRGPDPFLRAGELLSDLERWLAASSVQDRLGPDVDLAGFAHSTLSGFTSTPDVLATVGISTWVPKVLWVTALAVVFSLLLPLLRVPADGARVVGRYAGGQVALAAINGLLTLVVALILGAPGPVVLAVWGLALAFVPLVGLWISGGLLVLACSATPESTWVAAVVVLVYLQVEAYVLAPLVLARAVTLPAGVVVVVTAAGAAVGGLPGAVMAVPVVALAVSVERNGRLGRPRATGTLHTRECGASWSGSRA